jgi:hypothetical protein
VATTLVASSGLWGLMSKRFGWSLLPIGYRVRESDADAGRRRRGA